MINDIVIIANDFEDWNILGFNPFTFLRDYLRIFCLILFGFFIEVPSELDVFSYNMVSFYKTLITTSKGVARGLSPFSIINVAMTKMFIEVAFF